MTKAYMNWSGGKDSSLSLHKILQQKTLDVACLLTSINKVHDRISMHGVRTELLRQQALALNLPLKLIELPEHPGMEAYETAMQNKVEELKKLGIHDAIFGDIFLEDLRIYREEKLRPLGIKAHFPLWQISTKDLMNEFIDAGFKAVVVCTNEKNLDKSFCGRLLDRSFVNDLPKEVDVCGENGEYHSFVFDGPIFKNPIPFEFGEIVYRTYPQPKAANDSHYNEVCATEKNYGFYFCDLIPSH